MSENERLRKALRNILNSGVTDIDSRIDYIEVQVDRDDWIEAGQVLAEEPDEVDRDLLRRQLAEAYDGCIAAMWSVVMGKASPDTRTAFEFAEGAIRSLIPPQEATDEP